MCFRKWGKDVKSRKEGTNTRKANGNMFKSRKGNLKRKNLHCVFLSITEIRAEKTGPWLGKRDLEKAIGKTIMPASKEGQLNTNWTKRTSPPCVGFVGRESNVSLAHIKKNFK